MNFVLAEESVINLLVQFTLNEVGDFFDFEREVYVHGLEVNHLVVQECFCLVFVRENLSQVKSNFITGFSADEFLSLLFVFYPVNEHWSAVWKTVSDSCVVWVDLVNLAFEERFFAWNLSRLLFSGSVFILFNCFVYCRILNIDNVLFQRKAAVDVRVKFGSKSDVDVEIEIFVFFVIVCNIRMSLAGHGFAHIINFVFFEIIHKFLFNKSQRCFAGSETFKNGFLLNVFQRRVHFGLIIVFCNGNFYCCIERINIVSCNFHLNVQNIIKEK